LLLNLFSVMSISSKFDPKKVEDKWYKYWLKNKFFSSKPDNRKPYSIVIPPPNVTGSLHMGHMLNNTIQDILIRRARMQGYNACWVPGTDHASIATEAKVVDHLKKIGINKNDLSRKEFLSHAWEWKENYGGVILKQLQKIGCSCDWDRTKFTMDDSMNESVTKVFIDLYNKGLIYKGHRMVNWDPEAETTLSDEEVIYEERSSFLYYIAYKIENSSKKIIIATTRPETLIGDTAICVNPKDGRYNKLVGKNVIVPIVNRKIPIIEDEYVDKNFGTGCLKVTPAHDQNDKDLGEKHNLEIINIFNSNGTINHHGINYEGKDRFTVRKEIVEELDNIGLFVKKETYKTKIALSERTRAIIEPRLSDQWFLSMKEISKPAIKAVMESNEIVLFPEKFKSTFSHWMNNIRDWNISRQLWWGQQIPVYYFGKSKSDFVVSENKEKALKLAKIKSGNNNLKVDELTQDSDVLDTWFSSWIWPISVFDGIRFPNNKEIKYYYPTNDLVTGPDILFFWVSRMIISGFEFRNQIPFKNVYFTGLVRDKKGRKMSKQLGNSPDPLKLIREYGADSVRVGLMLCSSAGNDLLFDEKLCIQGKNFTNKIWNAYRLINSWTSSNDTEERKSEKDAILWYENKYNFILEVIENHFKFYRIKDAMLSIYKLIWDDFCSIFLEAVKPEFNSPINSSTLTKIFKIFQNNLKVLHPFMPFLTEELWEKIKDDSFKDPLIISSWPKNKKYNKLIINNFEFSISIISAIRKIRKEKGIAFKDMLKLIVISENSFVGYSSIIRKLGLVDSIEIQKTKPKANGVAFRIKKTDFIIPLTNLIDIEKDKLKLEEELKYAKGFFDSILKKLNNKNFLKNAPEKIINFEKKKLSDTKLKIDSLKKSMNDLS
jgi:valyl-tRNA synthetase